MDAPEANNKGTPDESRPDGERRAEVTKKKMAVGQQRRGDRGANGHRPEWGVTISTTGSCRRLDFRCWLEARSRYKGRGRRSGRDLEPCLQIHHVEAVGQERKCGGDGRGGRRPTEVWNVHGGPWCSLSASVLQCIANWWGRGIRGSPSTSSRLKPNVRAYTADALFRPDQGTRTRAGIPPFPRFSCRWPPSHQSGTCRYHVVPRRPPQRWMKRPTAYQWHLFRRFGIPSDVQKMRREQANQVVSVQTPNGPVPKYLPSSRRRRDPGFNVDAA